MINIGIGIPFGQRSAGIDPQAKIAFDSLQSAGFTTPQGITGINAAFKTIKTIYGTSDITTAISFFGDPSLAYQIGAGSGTTLGQAIRTLPNIIDPTRATDAVQTTAASQPLLLTHTTGQNYWFGSGVAGNFVSTPNAAANSNNGNKEFVFNFSTNNTSSLSNFVSKDDVGSNRAYAVLYDHTNQRFALVITTDLTSTTVVNTDSGTILRNYAGWYKLTFSFSGGILSIKTFNSLDNITYTEIGTTKTVNGNNFIGTNSNLIIGARSSTFDGCIAKINRITISNSIGGAPVVDFNPNQYNPSTSQTQWTSSTGEVWTINTGTATTGYKGVLVDRTTMQGDGIDDILTKTENIMAQFTVFNSNLGFAGAGTQGLLGRNGFNNLALIYDSATKLTVYKEGSFNYGSLTISRLNLLTIAYNSTSLQGLVNNVQQINNTSGTLITQGITQLFRGRTANSNALINTHIEVSIKSNSTQQTEMYNYIRSINNNAF